MKARANLFGVTFNSTIHLLVAVVQMQFFHILSYSHCLFSRSAIGIFTEVLTLPLNKMTKQNISKKIKIKNVNKKLEKVEGQMVTSIQQQFLRHSPDSAVRCQSSVSSTTEPNDNSD